MVKTRPTQIKDIVACAMQATQKKRQAAGALKTAWRLSAGAKAARHSCPKKLSRNTLTVTVDSPVWIYYLHNNKQAIESRITKELAAERAIKIRLQAGEGNWPESNEKTKKPKKTSKKSQNKHRHKA